MINIIPKPGDTCKKQTRHLEKREGFWKVSLAIIAVLIFALSLGCTSTSQSNITPQTITSVKAGMTKAEVTSLIGEPRSRAIESDGTETWQYRKNAKQGRGQKTYSDIVSFGLTSGVDAGYQDIFTVTFNDGIVLKSMYQENVNTLHIK
jgi:outer membrane protein assembly factor BamE (lipoprotein component of BamABCDE complex)